MLKSISRRLVLVSSAVLSVAVIAGCAASASNTGSSSASAQKTFFAQVYHENGRTYMFGDAKNYKQFLSVDEIGRAHV